MKPEEIQAEMDAIMDEMAAEVIENIFRDADLVVAKIDRIRRQVNGLLSEYSKQDGTISKSRINTLLQELDEIEFEIDSELTSELERLATKATEQAEKNLSEALVGLLGVAVAFGGTSLLPNVSSIIREVLDGMFNRDINGNDISEIIESVAGLVRDNIQRAIRYGVYREMTIGQISRRVKEEFDRTSFQIKRIITTEIPIAFRRAVAIIGSKTRIIKAVKIVDLPGRMSHPSTHHHHECFRLAEQDMYGWGKGVYRPQDTFIYDPHPQCTAYFRYIFDKEALNNADG